MKPEGKYIDKYFWITTPTRTESANVVDNEEEALNLRMKSEESENQNKPDDEKFQVISVPIVHRSAAEKNINGFLRDMCGIPTDAIRLFIGNKNLVFEANRDPLKNLPMKKDVKIHPNLCLHPFTGMTMNFEDGVQFAGKMCERFETGNIISGSNGRTDRYQKEVIFRPMINPEVPRTIHIDTGLTGDSAGFAMGHCYGWVKVVRLKDVHDSKGNVEIRAVDEVVPFTWIDVMMRIVPPKGGQISFAGLRGLVYGMQRMGFIIGKVTCDSFQSVAITQQLIEAGLKVEIVSVDRTTNPYDALLSAYQEKRISHYSYPIYEGEIGQLERVKLGNQDGKVREKVDHPPNGSKDVSDAVASVVFDIETNCDNRPYIPVELMKDELNITIDKIEKDISIHTAFDRGDFEKMMDMMGSKRH